MFNAYMHVSDHIHAGYLSKHLSALHAQVHWSRTFFRKCSVLFMLGLDLGFGKIGLLICFVVSY